MSAPEVKRYDLLSGINGYDLYPRNKGSWVEYGDYQVLSERHETLAAELAEAKERAEALEESLANAAGYLASVRTDRRVEREGDIFVLQTLEWAEGATQFAEDINQKLYQQEARSATSQEGK